jgi:hypothetical protein
MSNARLDKQNLDGKLTQSKAKLDKSKWTKMDQNGRKNIHPFLNWTSKLGWKWTKNCNWIISNTLDTNADTLKKKYLLY